jgi:predicted nucleic acid-binding protein
VIVLDASAAVELLLRTETGLRVARRVSARGQGLHAPELLDVEVLQVLRRFERQGTLSPPRAAEAVADLLALDVRRHPHGPLARRAWEMSGAVTAYDALYLTLAEGLRSPLLTTDARLAKAAGHRARVELV